MTTPTLRLELARSCDEIARLFSSLASVQDVADLLEVPREVLVYILYRTDARTSYRTFPIPKRSGGERIIAEPPASLKILQAKLNTVLQCVYSPKPSAHGFVKNRSILSNALRHTGKRNVLNIDLKGFFPSIHFGRVRGMLMGKPYRLPQRAATVLAQMCCDGKGGDLPQGAPTSPTISNMICAKLDSDLQKLAREHKCTYTRYADDITFSTTRTQLPSSLAHAEGGWGPENVELGRPLVSAIEDNGFAINPRKVRLQIRGSHQEVTGLTVNKFPNVKRRYVRQIRAMIHAWEEYGLEAAEAHFHEKYDHRARNQSRARPRFAHVVRGKLDFLKMVKGEGDTAYRTLATKLHELDPDLISLPADLESGDEEPTADPTWASWYSQYSRLVYHVEAKEGRRVMGGTAFAWRKRILITAAHVLTGDVSISPPFPEGTLATDFAKHSRAEDGVDIAAVRLIAGSEVDGPHLPVRYELPNPGEQVAAIGFPSVPGRQALAEPGLYVGRVESISTDYHETFMTVEVDLSAAGGLSGAPVIDRGGKLVGVMIEQTWEEVDEDVPARPFNHFLPIEHVKELDL